MGIINRTAFKKLRDMQAQHPDGPRGVSLMIYKQFLEGKTIDQLCKDLELTDNQINSQIALGGVYFKQQLEDKSAVVLSLMMQGKIPKCRIVRTPAEAQTA